MLSHLKTYFTHSRSWAVGLVFAAMGFLFGDWVTLIPYVKSKFELDDAQLGLLLLSMPLGSVMGNPLSTFIIGKFGMRNTTIWGMVTMSFAYALPVNSPTILLTSLSLVLTGLALSTTNVAMNTCVTSIERDEKRNIMSTSHGMFSIGGMLGATFSSIFIGLHIRPSVQMLVVVLALFVMVYFIRPIILSIHEEKQPTEKGSKFSWPTGALLGMIAISLCTNLTEGIMADWTAVYMKEIVQTDAFFIGWGFSGYAFLMAAGRFLGDGLIPKFGRSKILIFGGLIASVGILIAVVFPFTYSAILGFGLVGAGVSCAAPILYGSAARVPNMAKGAGLATMNTFSIAGFLIGPALIGFLSNAYGLQIAISLVLALGIIWTVLSSKIKLF